jgi:hypothetical protein
MNAIPKETAIKICQQIQDEREKKIYSVGEIQCVACLKSAKGDPDRMCFSSTKDYRGCEFINKRFDKGTY